MNLHKTLVSQYLATLAMLRATVEQCPSALWADPENRNQFWHVAYHALFYTHLYLQSDEESFVPWEKQRQDYQFMGPTPWPPHEVPEIGEPYTQPELIEYIALLETEIPETLASLDLEAEESGFDWLPLGKLELQLYTIRHLQHHTGELADRLGRQAGIDVGWVGMVRDE